MGSKATLEDRNQARAWPRPAGTARELLAGAALLLVATVAAYFPAIHAGFIWDDPQYVLNNPTLRSLEGLRNIWFLPTSLPQWYPMVHTTFWIEYHLVGAHPLLYHVDNVLLHVTSAIVLWRLLSRLDVPGAYIAACLFALHPVMVESVAWVTERKNVLSLVFYLLAMWVYLFRFLPSRNRRAYALALILFLCALFSKTVTASFPAAVLLILWWQEGRLSRREVLPLAPFFLAGIVLSAVTAYLENHHVAGGQSIPELQLPFESRCIIAGRAIWFYVGKLLFPHPLSFIYPRWHSIDPSAAAQWAFPAMAVTVAAVLFLLQKRLGRGLLVAWLLFCGTLFPALGFVNVYPMRFSFVADHFQYHASIALIALAAAIAGNTVKVMRSAVAVIVVTCLGYLTWDRAHVYRDSETLWRDTLAKNPDSWMVNLNLANVLVRNDPPAIDEAETLYRRALELAPNLYETHTDVGMMEGMRGRTDAALRELDQALRINPAYSPAYYHRGQVFSRLQDADRAVDNFELALQFAPGFPEAHYRLALALLKQAGDAQQRFVSSHDQADAKLSEQKFFAAVDHLRSAVAANNDYAAAHAELGLCLIRLRHFDEAISSLREAVRLDANNAQAWTNLGSALYQSGRVAEAATAFGRALEIDPNLAPARRGASLASSARQDAR
jgi:tetratricopeptide (TPR) repeat protein